MVLTMCVLSRNMLLGTCSVYLHTHLQSTVLTINI